MLRLMGAGCIVAGSGAFGFAMAAASRREEKQLRQLLGALENLYCELSYRLTPLPNLCRGAAEGRSGAVSTFFLELARELEKQTEADAQCCVKTVLASLELPPSLGRILSELGQTLGRFDLPGQLRGLELSIRETEQALRTIREGAPERRRSWQTLGLCVGAALAILFV